jgi:hypothetical protein
MFFSFIYILLYYLITHKYKISYLFISIKKIVMIMQKIE